MEADSKSYWLNMELDLLDLQSLFGLHVHSCTHRLRDPASPAFWLIYEGAIGQWSAEIGDFSLWPPAKSTWGGSLKQFYTGPVVMLGAAVSACQIYSIAVYSHIFLCVTIGVLGYSMDCHKVLWNDGVNLGELY